MDARSLEAEEDRIGMHGPSPILGPDGKPIPRTISPSERRKLSEELARPELAGVRSFWDQSAASGLTPERLAGLLRGAIRGDVREYLELAEEMEEREPHYFSVIGTRKRALSGIRPSVEPASAKKSDAKIVKAVEELLDDPSFPDTVEDLLDALGKGYSAVEIVWFEAGGLWKPYRYVWRDPKYFTFDYVSRSELRLAELGTIDGVALAPGKFIIHVPKQKSGVPIRGGFARFAAWSFLFKNYSVKDWAAFLDVYGMPIRVGKYHPSATPEERRKLLQAVMNIASDAAAIIPESMLIELLEVKNTGAGTMTPFEGLARFMDEQLSKMILGQTMTVEKGGSLAQAKVHNQVRIDLLRADARQLAVTINRDLVSWFVKLNFGDQAEIPRVKFPVAEPEDIAVLSTALGALVPLGLKVDQAEVRDKLGLREPEHGAELLTAPKAPPSKPKVGAETEKLVREAVNAQRLVTCPCGCGERVAFNAEAVTGELDEVDRIGADEAADWEPVMTPIVAAVLDAAKRATSFEEFKAALDALHGALDVSALEKRVAIAQMKARGLGDATNGRT